MNSLAFIWEGQGRYPYGNYENRIKCGTTYCTRTRSFGSLPLRYHSDLAQCEILPPGSRYTNAWNFRVEIFVPFSQPDLFLIFINTLVPKTDRALVSHACAFV
ncbi:hypothetical protein B0H66DRAFT_561366 [Apodospora peruviana]|uniref:Uncharacterized protein n=1 Tax=Apodospora peruviana TaxID=516989 RepID=A0AAE0I0U9_9PEZI|nr:hypothetical protein B0H66DRAFT_561366 [Apodospora peruviana]